MHGRGSTPQMAGKSAMRKAGDVTNHAVKRSTRDGVNAFSYPEPFLRAVNGARRGALAKSISNWHLIGYNECYFSNTGYILLPCFYGIRFWIWPEPLVAPRVRRALGTRMGVNAKQVLLLYTLILMSCMQCFR